MNQSTRIETINEPPPGVEYVHFHGFNSSRESSTGLALQGFLGEKLWRVEYDYIDPDIAYHALNDLLVRLLQRNSNLRLIGNSLGGFWANHFANKYGLKVVLINPCYQPSVLLQKYLGLNKNHYTLVTREMAQTQIDGFAKYEALENQLVERVVIISGQDETIPPEENRKFFENWGKIITCPNEGHQFRDMPVLFAAVLSLGSDLA